MSSFFLVLRRVTQTLALATAATGAQALELLQDSSFSGFATLGLVSSDNEHLAFRRDITQERGSRDGSVAWRTDSMVGLQWYGRWSPRFDATVQVVARDQHDNSLEAAIQWAFVRYRPTDSVDVRVGRLGTDVFLLSEYRLVGYALPWVRPPQDFYGFLPLYHIDGLDVSRQLQVGDGTLDLKAFYGVFDESYPGGDEDYGGTRLKFRGGGVKLGHQLGNWHWRYTYAKAEIRNNFAAPITDVLQTLAPLWPEAAAIAAEISTEGDPLNYHALGLTYDNNTWWARTEAASLSSHWDMRDETYYFYASLGRRIGEFTVFAIHGQARATAPLPDYQAPPGYPPPLSDQLTVLAEAANAITIGGRQDQHSYGAGLRWDFRPKMAVKLQVEQYEIDKNGSSMWLREDNRQLTEDQATNVVSLSWDVLF